MLRQRAKMISLPMISVSKFLIQVRIARTHSADRFRNPAGRSSFSPPTRQYEWCIRAPVADSRRSWTNSRSMNE